MPPKKLPKKLYKYFWDVDAEKVNPSQKPTYVIERLLEYGDEKSLSWMSKNFKTKLLKNVLKKSRQLSIKTANFFSHLFRVSPKDILCLQKDFQNKQKKIWKY